jgi:prevent-host-death family protein
MVTTLREAKTRLSQLVAMASRGEEILITVRGKPTAKLIRIGNRSGAPARWQSELLRLQARYGTGRAGLASEIIIDQLREERG